MQPIVAGLRQEGFRSCRLAAGTLLLHRRIGPESALRGHVERKLLFFERLMHAGGEPCNCLLAISVSGPLAESTFRVALDRLQALHPALRLDVVDRDGTPWFVERPDPDPVPLRILERIGEDAWQRELERELDAGFPGGRGPLFRVVWLRGDDVSDLIFVCHHCIGDGITTVMLARKALNLATRDDITVTGDMGIGGLQDMFGAERLSDPGLRRRARRMAMAARLLLPLAARLLGTGWEPSANHAHLCQIDKAMSRRLRDEARARGVPLFAIVGATLARAFREVRGARAARQIVCAVDLRGSLPLLSRHAMFPLADSVSIPAPRDPDPWVEAAHFAAALTTRAARLDSHARLVAGEMMPHLAAPLLRLVRNARGRHDFVFAYLGTPALPVLESPYGFRAMLAGGAAMPWRNSTTVSCFTVKSCLSFVMIGRPPSLLPDDARAVVAAFPRLLAAAFG